MRENKNEEAYRQIKSEIIEGSIDSTTPISETILVEKLDISRTPIRAALQRLQSEGFIRIIPNQGIVVKDISMEEANEMYDTRILVENYMIDRSFPLLNDVDLRDMRELLSEQSKACDERDFKAYLLLDIDFHAKSYSRYHNEKMSEIIINYKERFSRPRMHVIQNNGRMENGLREHYDILEKLENNEVDAAIEAAKKHINKGALRGLSIYA